MLLKYRISNLLECCCPLKFQNTSTVFKSVFSCRYALHYLGFFLNRLNQRRVHFYLTNRRLTVFILYESKVKCDRSNEWAFHEFTIISFLLFITPFLIVPSTRLHEAGVTIIIFCRGKLVFRHSTRTIAKGAGRSAIYLFPVFCQWRGKNYK